MKKKDFYIVTKGDTDPCVVLRHGYEDDKCFYNRSRSDPDFWIATDKSTGLRIAIRKSRKELIDLIHSDSVDRSIKENIALNPKRYQDLCDAYRSAIHDKEHKYIIPD